MEYNQGQQSALSTYRQPVSDSPNKPLSNVGQAQAELSNAIGQLHSIIEKLLIRLQPVLSSPRPQEVGRESTPPSPTTVTNAILGSAAGVQEAQRRIVELIERLEV